MLAVKERAYAKINLFLDVVGLRDDGFHDIRTVMQSISLFDEISVSKGQGKGGNVRIQLTGNRRLPSDNKNLAIAAARLFLAEAAINDDIEIKLNKTIPVAAGLAGGSADAAATLRALNKLYNKPFADKRLLSLAERLGSDVPFCLVGKTALCEGRGERITRLSSPCAFHVVVAVANERVSTPAAYSELDRMYSSFDGSVKRESEDAFSTLMSALSERQVPSVLYNIFEDAILPSCDGAANIKKLLLQLGADAALMSGSGPSVFGIFPYKEKAICAKEALLSEGYTAYMAETVI